MSEINAQDKILLIEAPPWGVDTPPLGVAYLSTFLKSKGFFAEIFDLNLELFRLADKELQKKWLVQDFHFWASAKATEVFYDQLEYWADRILSFEARIIGFSTTFASAPFLNALLMKLRKKVGDGVVIIVGGAGTNDTESRFWFRKDLIDYCIVGEGEYSLFYFLKDIQQNKAVQSGLGYSVWKDHSCDKTICLRTLEENGKDINEIPFPTFEEFNLDNYTSRDLLPILSSRGCVRSCVFCRDAPIKKPYRWRNPELVASEIKYLVKRHNRKRFEFCDLLINGNLGFLNILSSLLLKMDLGVSWGGQATVRRDMCGNLLKKMKKAGCGGLTFGCESFSDRVLKLMRKGITSGDARNSIVRAKKAGMRVELNLIVGFPGETEKDIDENIRFLRKNAKWIDKINSLNICTIEPGMYIYDHLEEFGIDKAVINDWFAWFTKDLTNTLEMRLKRHKRLTEACLDFNLEPQWQNTKR